MRYLVGFPCCFLFLLYFVHFKFLPKIHNHLFEDLDYFTKFFHLNYIYTNYLLIHFNAYFMIALDLSLITFKFFSNFTFPKILFSIISKFYLIL